MQVMRLVRTICGVLCFGIGLAFTVNVVNTLLHPSIYSDLVMPSFFAGVFLLGSLLLLRRK